MISALYILNYKGDSIIQKIFSDNFSNSIINVFRMNVIHKKASYALPPVNIFEGTSFMHILLTEGIWMVVASQKNTNCAMVFEFMTQFRKIVRSYIGSITEDKIAQKYALVIELLEEVMDHGFPQITDITSLKLWVTQKALKNASKLADAVELTNQLTGQITWRKPNLKYKKNEIFIDVMEKVNVLMSAQGKVLSNSVDGVVSVKTRLSGMPECKCGINDKFLVEIKKKSTIMDKTPKIQVALEDCTFHQCVRLNKYETEKSITFVPPDGRFELLKYRSTHFIQLPFRIFPIIKELGNFRVEMKVVLKSEFKSMMSGVKIEVIVPVPETTASINTNVSKGRTKFRRSENCIAWRIKKMQGMKEAHLEAMIELTPNIMGGASIYKNSVSKKKPINLKFEIPFSVCGMKVRYLKVYEPKLNYSDQQVIKWIRYVSQQGVYEFRV